MDLKHKHWALIFFGIFTAVFVLLLVWHLLASFWFPYPESQNASSTQQAAFNPNTVEAAHIKEIAAYYEIDLTYPSNTPLKGDQNKAAIVRMRSAMNDVAIQFKKDGNFANLTHDDVQIMGLDQRKMALSSEYTTYMGSSTVSYVFAIYEDTLGAHPNAFYTTFTFDLQSGAVVSLRDLFSTPSYLDLLSSRVRADLPEIVATTAQIPLADADTAYINSGTGPVAENFANFAIDGRTLRIIFTPYQVGPWALGTVIDPIPLTELSEYLRPAYQ